MKKRQKKIYNNQECCVNCANFKTRDVSLSMVQRAYDALRGKGKPVNAGIYNFPITLALLKVVKKFGICKIFYCSLALLHREVYVRPVDSDYKLDQINPIRVPCPCYK